ncbi:hypothetical protein M0802_009597 [Mischocyttarus mexicanus]|nr:hypothetical protein M0802_009597 [Mischocyttarus mexicanus]
MIRTKEMIKQSTFKPQTAEMRTSHSRVVSSYFTEERQLLGDVKSSKDEDDDDDDYSQRLTLQLHCTQSI